MTTDPAEIEALRILADLDDDGIGVTWPPGHNSLTARLCIRAADLRDVPHIDVSHVACNLNRVSSTGSSSVYSTEPEARRASVAVGNRGRFVVQNDSSHDQLPSATPWLSGHLAWGVSSCTGSIC